MSQPRGVQYPLGRLCVCVCVCVSKGDSTWEAINGMVLQE